MSISLVACAMRGPLYHPGQKTPYGPPRYSPFHSAKYYEEQAAKKEKNQKIKNNASLHSNQAAVQGSNTSQ